MTGLKPPIVYMELTFCNCLTGHMLQHYFHDRQKLASSLKLHPAERNPSDLAAMIFKYCAVQRISLVSIIMQLAE